ncbi:MAG: 6-bladed beta-propeller [Candidatus Aminicenantes bacterium]|nr:6-bladed beta-propeller [Candidatus Aminicenantes bacterium]
MLSQSLRNSVLFLLILSVAGFANGYSRSVKAQENAQQQEVKVISNPKEPVPPPGQRKRLVFKEELTIGQVEGDDHYMFGEAVAFNTDEKGNFYVTDWRRRRILKYDPAGQYQLTIGREGQGPGEFQNLSPARFDKDGHIYITDLVSRRISFFDDSGNYLRQIAIPDVFEDLHISGRGHFISTHTIPLEGESSRRFKLVYGMFDDKFNVVTEFLAQEKGFKLPAGRDAQSAAKFLAGILSDIAYQARPSYRLGKEDSIFFGYPEKYAIDVFSSEGRKVRTIQRDYEPSRVTEKDKDKFVGQVAADYLRRYSSEQERKEIVKYIEYPKYKPAYHSFALMENGWLVVAVEIVPDGDNLFDLFDEDGRYIGQFQADFPADTWFFFKNGKAYAVAEKDGYKFVKRYAFEIQDY